MTGKLDRAAAVLGSALFFAVLLLYFIATYSTFYTTLVGTLPLTGYFIGIAVLLHKLKAIRSTGIGRLTTATLFSIVTLTVIAYGWLYAVITAILLPVAVVICIATYEYIMYG